MLQEQFTAFFTWETINCYNVILETEGLFLKTYLLHIQATKIVTYVFNNGVLYLF